MKLLLSVFLLVTGFLTNAPGRAEPASEPTPSAMELAIQKAGQEAMKVATHGPAQVRLGDQAVIALPRGYQFVPQPEAGRFMEAMGNSNASTMLGLIFPDGDNAGNWLVVADLEPSGYVKDDEARDWDADELLVNLKEGTEAGNEARRARGIPEFEVIGWAEKPAYDAATHRLVWSALAQDKGSPADAVQTVNYNTYALGRDGYISLNLITDSASVEADKPVAKTLLAALEYLPGKRYTDFDANTDKVAEYGLAALVAGVAAKKLGLFAMVGAFLLKFLKPLLLVGAGLVAGVRKWVTRNAE